MTPRPSEPSLRVQLPRLFSLLAERRMCGYQSSTQAKIRGTTIVASDSMMNLGVSTPSFPHVIFSFGTAPEYDP